MKKLTVNICNTILIALVSLIFAPVPALAQTQVQYEIQQLDSNAETFTYEKKAARDGLRNLTTFAMEAEVWFGKFDRVNADIRKAQQGTGQYTTFSPSQLNDALNQLHNERSRVLSLNGGATIGGQFFTSMAQLKAAYANNQERNDLYQRYSNASTSLTQINRQRDVLSSRLEEQEKNELSLNKMKLRDLEEDLIVISALANDPNLVCLVGFDMVTDGAPPYMTRKMFGSLVKEKYLNELISTPGKKFNKEEIKQRLLGSLALSNTFKNQIRTIVIPEKQQEIEELRRKIAAEENRSTDISGCWVIFLPDNDNPVINITKGSYDGIPGYVARITNPGALEYLRSNHTLFVVNSVNRSVFEGWEYATDAKGNASTTRLRLLLNNQGDRMDYRADDMLTMGRCD